MYFAVVNASGQFLKIDQKSESGRFEFRNGAADSYMVCSAVRDDWPIAIQQGIKEGRMGVVPHPEMMFYYVNCFGQAVYLDRDGSQWIGEQLFQTGTSEALD